MLNLHISLMRDTSTFYFPSIHRDFSSRIGQMTGLDVEQKISEQLAGRGDGNEEYRAEVSHRPLREPREKLEMNVFSSFFFFSYLVGHNFVRIFFMAFFTF